MVKEGNQSGLSQSIKSFFDRRTLKSIGQLFIGSVLYSVGVVWLLNAGEFFAGGVTGISQLLSFILFDKVVPWLGIIIFAVNIPLLLFGWKGMSKKFAILTLFSIIVQSVSVALFQWLYDLGLQFTDTLTFSNGVLDTGSRLLLAVLGGGFTGYANSLCLKSGGSSGGMDIISNYLMVKKNVSFTKYSFIVDFIIISCSAVVVGIQSALLTVVRLIVGVITINHFYTSYQVVKIQITTEKIDDMRQALISKFHHGVTIYSVIGGYTMKEKWVIDTVVSKYELNDYLTIIREVDSKAFVSVSKINSLIGNYNKKTVL